MKITVELELSSPYELSAEEIENDLRKNEDQIGWNYDYIIKKVVVTGSTIREGKMYRCEDCRHCDVENLKCHPESRDCRAEYDLTFQDLRTSMRCDFYEPKGKENRKRQ